MDDANRTPLSAADLFVLLDREFRRRRPRECADCFVTLPFRVDSRSADRPNWELVALPGCAASCALVLEELIGEYQRRYDLASART